MRSNPIAQQGMERELGDGLSARQPRHGEAHGRLGPRGKALTPAAGTHGAMRLATARARLRV